MVKDGAFSHKIGHLNRFIVLKVTAILMNREILPSGGVASGRVCACSLRRRRVLLPLPISWLQSLRDECPESLDRESQIYLEKNKKTKNPGTNFVSFFTFDVCCSFAFYMIWYISHVNFFFNLLKFMF